MELSRRRFLGSVAVGIGGAFTKTRARTGLTADVLHGIVPCHGVHQAGVTTPPQRFLQLGGFDVTATDRRSLVDLLRAWQRAIELLTKGRSLVDDGDALGDAPADTGEAIGQNPALLTITIGFGAGLFDDRFGLRAARPAQLVDLPPFPGERLDPARGGGDLSVQACADSAIVAEHAVRALARVGAGATTVRWVQSGSLEPPSPPGTPRNLLGFKDGTANPDLMDGAQMDRHVWAAASDGKAWMAGGTYQVYRRIRLRLRAWDASSLREQQEVIGRAKLSGAPFGGFDEFDPVQPDLLPGDSHVRLANPRSGQASERERILRRGYNFHDGLLPGSGAYDAGLAFIAYQRDPRHQFIPIQRRLAAGDALNEYLVHVASGIFAVPPGTDPGGFVGARLLHRL